MAFNLIQSVWTSHKLSQLLIHLIQRKCIKQPCLPFCCLCSVFFSELLSVPVEAGFLGASCSSSDKSSAKGSSKFGNYPIGKENNKKNKQTQCYLEEQLCAKPSSVPYHVHMETGDRICSKPWKQVLQGPGTPLSLPALQTLKSYISVQFSHIFFLLGKNNANFGCFNAWTRFRQRKRGESKLT